MMAGPSRWYLPVKNLPLYKQPRRNCPAGNLRLIHYQTLEPVKNGDLQILSRVKSKFNEDRNFWERLKLWRKSDILEGMEPSEARWGFTRPRDEGDRQRVILAVREMSRATPRLTWLLYEDGNGGKETVLKGGMPAVPCPK